MTDPAQQVQLGHNPLASGFERPPVPPTTFVIFGGTGDLSQRKLLPALYNLAHDGRLPHRFRVIGASSSEYSDEQYRSLARDAITQHSRTKPKEAVLERLLELITFRSIPFEDQDRYKELAKDILPESDDQNANNVAFYLATAPKFFSVISDGLRAAGLNKVKGMVTRLIVEKPFGHDAESAAQLQLALRRSFSEKQIYRIDHYLGKETVQNILALRFANTLFEPVWNRNYIDRVEITAAETVGVGSRAGYYEGAGALRDLVQNHMLQLLTLLCMEPPTTLDPNRVRDEKVKVLEAIRPMTPEEVKTKTVRAHYCAGNMDGDDVKGYLEEDGVAQDSNTETYAALELKVNNWRWAGVPIYLRTGKRLARQVTEIAVTLKPVPHLAFQADESSGVTPNQIVLNVQPDEGVTISLGAKIPATRMKLRNVNMEFLYGSSFVSRSPEAYERLITDVMLGDPTLFTRDDEVTAQWAIIDPILKAWAKGEVPLYGYPAASDGPVEADQLLKGEVGWRQI